MINSVEDCAEPVEQCQKGLSMGDYGLFALARGLSPGVLLLLNGGGAMLTDAQWAESDALIEACRPK